MQTFKLRELCEFEKGTTGLAKAEPGDYPLVTTGAERKTCNTYQFDTKAVCIPLVSSTGHGHASLKNVHYQEGKFALGSILVALTSKDDLRLDIQFLHLYFSQLKDEVLVPLMSGAANVALSIKKIQDIEIPLPTIDRQREIVQRFNSIVIEENELNSELIRQQNLLKKLRQQILQEAIVGKLTGDWRAQNPDVEPASELLERIAIERAQQVKDKKIRAQKPFPPVTNKEKLFELPLGWEWCRLANIANVGTGATPLTTDPSYYDGHINWMTSADTGKKYVRFTKEKITEKAIRDTNCKIYPIGTLVIAMYGQGKTRGQITELKIEAATNQACAAISIHCFTESFNQFVKIHFWKMYDEIRRLARGGAQPNLNMDKIKSSIIALPPLAEQEVIVAKVQKLLSLCDEIESHVGKNQIYAKQLMRAVIIEDFSHNNKADISTAIPKASAHTLVDISA